MQLINDISDNLDVGRKLPAYQLERRADIFLSIYLPDILSNKFGVRVEGVIPEFPIDIGTIHAKVKTNLFSKITNLE